MKKLQSKHLLRMMVLCAGAAAATLGPTIALAQDRLVGREALDPKDRENLPPAIDGRTDSDEDVDPRALEDFREPLAPHGAWVDDPTYGTVWIPNARVVGRDFTPYQTAGRWELTSEGDWLWVSDYEWGEIPFHYGRWVWIEGQGWAWIPGRVWAPAWVVWRTGPYGYVGWGPCPPTWGWYGGSAVWLWWPPYSPYWFVETRYVFVRHLHTHVIREPARVANAARQTTPLRRPASPATKGLDGHRPAHPDFDQLRYEGSRPTARPARPHPEVGPDRSTTAKVGGASARHGLAARRDSGLGTSRAPGAVGSRSGHTAPGPRSGRGVAPSTRPGAPSARGQEPRGVQPRGADARPSPARSTERDERPDREPRAPSEPSLREPGTAPARDAAPRDLPERGAGPDRSAGPSSPSRPSPPPPAARKPSTSAPVPAPARGPQRSPHRGRR